MTHFTFSTNYYRLKEIVYSIAEALLINILYTIP